MLNQILERLVSLLPAKAQPYAKVTIPSLVALITIGLNYAATGEFDPNGFQVAVGGLVLALLTFAVPNKA